VNSAAVKKGQISLAQWPVKTAYFMLIVYTATRFTEMYCRQLFSTVADPKKIDHIQSIIQKPETAHISFRLW